MKIVFDATILLNGLEKNSSRSGIYFASRNILHTLKIRRDVEVALYFSPQRMAEALILCRGELSSYRCMQNFSKHKQLLKMNLFLKLFHKKLIAHYVFRKPVALLFLITQKIIEYVYNDKFIVKKINEMDYFLSPIFQIPPTIREQGNLKFATILHDTIPFKYPSYDKTDWSKNLKEICSSFDKNDLFFCNSEQTFKDFTDVCPSVTKTSSVVSYLAVDDSFQVICDHEKKVMVKNKYGIPQTKKYVFSLCTIEPRKNLVRAVRTFIEFVNKHKINDLIWVMGGGQWDSFIEELKRQNIDWNSNLIVKAGYIDDEDLPVLYSNAEWFVYTSQYEGFGLPPLEAMQCGCPVITSNNSSLPEVVGDAGIMIDWDSDEQHIEAYEKYYFNSSLREENSRKGIERTKLFSWEKTVDLMVEFMKEKKIV